MAALRKLLWSLKRTLTGRRRQSVLLTSNFAPYNGEFGKADVWGVNFAYKKSKLDRLYAMDHIDEWIKTDPEWIDAADGLNIPVVMQSRTDRIAKSEPFKLRRISGTFGTPDYFTNTVGYMFADALAEGYGTVVIHRIMASVGSEEYFEQKACLDYWAGVAAGLGVTVVTTADCNIGRPYPWQSNLYGYVTQDQWALSAKLVSDGVKSAVRLPRHFRVAGEQDKTKDAA